MKNFIRNLVIFLFCLGVVAPAFSTISLNLYGKAMIPFGDYSKYVATNLGGGVGAELDPLFIPNLGTSLHVDFHAGILKDDRIESMWNMAIYAGIWYRLRWGDFAFQPELNYGISLHNIKMKSGWHGPDEVNTDQLLQFVPAFRWTPNSDKGGKTSLDAAPFYAMIFEESNIIHQLGFKLGLVYIFD